MPNIKSAKKRLRSSLTRREINAPRRTRTRSARRAFDEAVASGDKEAGDKAFRVLCSSMDKAVKAKILSRNTATRGKTRAANRLRKPVVAG